MLLRRGGDPRGPGRAQPASADGSIEGLKADGIAVRGQVGDADPLTALEDALSVFEADAVVISTLPPGESHWQEKGLLGDAEARLSVPVHHFVTEYGLDEARRERTAN